MLSAQEAGHTCRILFLNGPQQAQEKYYLFDGKNSQEVTLPRLSFSPVYKLRPGDIKVWLLNTPVGKPEEVPPGAPSVSVNSAIRDFYLLISTDPANTVLPLRMHAVNANYDKIRLGEMLWINLTPKHLAGKIGRSPLNLGPNESTLVREPANAPGDYPVEIYFRVPDDDRTHPLVESQWRHDPRSRFVVFVYDEGRRRAPRVMSFADFRIAEKKEKE
jgi:hypothetical protein